MSRPFVETETGGGLRLVDFERNFAAIKLSFLCSPSPDRLEGGGGGGAESVGGGGARSEGGGGAGYEVPRPLSLAKTGASINVGDS